MISANILAAKRLIRKIEELNANPDLNGKKSIYDALIDLEVIVNQMLIDSADYAHG